MSDENQPQWNNFYYIIKSPNVIQNCIFAQRLF